MGKIIRLLKIIYFRLIILPALKRKAYLWAHDKPFIKNVYIYGSYIKGNNHKNSDLDIAIEHEKFEKDDNSYTTYFFEKKKWKAEIEKALSFPNVHIEWSKFEHVGQYVAQGSILLYERNSVKS